MYHAESNDLACLGDPLPPYLQAQLVLHLPQPQVLIRNLQLQPARAAGGPSLVCPGGPSPPCLAAAQQLVLRLQQLLVLPRNLQLQQRQAAEVPSLVCPEVPFRPFLQVAQKPLLQQRVAMHPR